MGSWMLDFGFCFLLLLLFFSGVYLDIYILQLDWEVD